MRGVRAHPATGAKESQRRAAREDHIQQRMLHSKGLDLAREDAAVEQPDDIDLECIADGLREPDHLAGEQVAVRGAAVELGNDMQVRQA